MKKVDLVVKLKKILFISLPTDLYIQSASCVMSVKTAGLEVEAEAGQPPLVLRTACSSHRPPSVRHMRGDPRSV